MTGAAPTRDRLGLVLTTSEASARAYVDAVDRMLAAWPGAGERLADALAADPDFALAHVAEARLRQMQGRVADARAAAGRARDLCVRATRRERGHVEAIALLIDGKPRESLAAVEAHLDEFPTDSLVLSLALGAFGLYAFSGRADHDAVRLARCQRLAARQPGDDWWFLTYLGWAYTEAGDLEAGERITARGFELRRENAHGAHALAHALHESGQHASAVAHLDGWLPDYDSSGQLYCHLHWHRALLDVQAGETGLALARLAEHMHPARCASPPINIMTDGASLLWRIMLYEDAPPPLPWQDLAAYGERVWPQPAVPFIDVHCAMASAGDGDQDAARRRADALVTLDADGRLPPGPLPGVLARAAAAYAAGDFAAAADAIESVLADLPRLGGSHAQREVHEETLIRACLRCGRTQRARALLAQRLARRPSAVDARWLDAAGSHAGATISDGDSSR